MNVKLQPADIFLTQGTGFISRAIRVFTRSVGESRTRVNHVGLIVTPGTLRESVAVEALSKVVRRKLWDGYGPPSTTKVAVYRPMNLTEAELDRIVEAAESYVGRDYGYLKVAAHLADWALMGAYVFRRLARMDDYPICSWLVAHCYEKVDKTFDVAPGAASPDDIWDFIVSHPEIYREVYPLKPI